MQKVDHAYNEKLMDRIGEGIVEAVRQEVEERRRLGLPLHISRNGKLITIWPDGTETPTTPDEDATHH